jgi:hypothetical protein
MPSKFTLNKRAHAKLRVNVVYTRPRSYADCIELLGELEVEQYQVGARYARVGG